MATYKILVKTGNVKNAGTDAGVFILLIGDFGNEKFFLNSSANDFERDSLREYTVQTNKSLGYLRSIGVGHDNIGNNPGWFLDYVAIRQVETGWMWDFNCHRWLAKSEDDGLIIRNLLGVPKGKTTIYKIRVKTGNVKRAGTDANVSITLMGNGFEEKFFLNSLDNDFEQNSDREYFVETFLTYGEMTKVRIQHDNSKSNPGWFLSFITVTEMPNGKTWSFPCNRWLAKDEDDGQIVRILNRQ